MREEPRHVSTNMMNWSRRQFLQCAGSVFVVDALRYRSEPILGLVVPSGNSVPAEALTLYPSGIRFVTAALTRPGDPPLTGTIATYERLQDRIVPATRALMEMGANGVVLLGTSVTFYKGAAHNQSLIDSIRSLSKLPATTMSSALVEGLKVARARRVTVASGYTEEVNSQLKIFLQESGFEVVGIRGLGLLTPADNPDRSELETFVFDVFQSFPPTDAVVMAFASTRTLESIAPLEQRCKVPVVSARPHAFWAGIRLLGVNARVPGFGTILADG